MLATSARRPLAALFRGRRSLFQRGSPTRVLRAAPLLVGVAAGCTRDVEPPAITDAAYQESFAKHLATRQTWLKTAGKAASYTGLHWLHEGTSTVGADSSNVVVLSGRNVPAHVGTLRRQGDSIWFAPAPGAAVLVDSAPAVARLLVVEAGTATPTRVTAGTAGFRIIKRVDSIGVRSWDADRAANNSIAPLTYFKLDRAWRLGGRFTRNAHPDTLAVPTVAGVAEEYIDVGRIAATIGGKPYTLTAYAGNGPTDLFLTFSDATSGEETYGFRFIHAALDTVTNKAVLDFNFAYNPECAFSAYTTCPLPPPNNRLAARITAGEQTAKHLADAKH